MLAFVVAASAPALSPVTATLPNFNAFPEAIVTPPFAVSKPGMMTLSAERDPGVPFTLYVPATLPITMVSSAVHDE
jgi:hypothetical protein